jgi:hypothetical protein
MTNRRMSFQLSNLDRKEDGERRSIRRRAEQLRAALTERTLL